LESLDDAVLRDLTRLSICGDGRIVIPIWPSNSQCRKEDSDSVGVFSLENPLDTRLDAHVEPHFPLESSLAITVNKSEGQTLDDGVILALSRRAFHNFTHAGLYVALTRVRERSDLRLFMAGADLDSLVYLEALKPSYSIGAFFRGYGRQWSLSDWLHNPFRHFSVTLYATSLETGP
jgi:hypothetical protein